MRTRPHLLVLTAFLIGAIPGAVSAQAPPVAFHADFHAPLPKTFTIERGAWNAKEGTLTQSNPTGTALLLRGQSDWNNYTLTAQVRIPHPELGSAAGLVMQNVAPGEYVVLSLELKPGGPYAVLRIHTARGKGLPSKGLTGDEYRLGSTFALDGWHELRADVHDNAFNGYVDGQRVVSFQFIGTPPSWYNAPQTWPVDPTHGLLGLMTQSGAADFRDLAAQPLRDFTQVITPQSARYDASGHILPRQSYASTMRQLTQFIVQSNQMLDKSSVPPALRHLPPYLLTSFAFSDDTLNGLGGEFAFNGALFISGMVRYYHFSGDPRPLYAAERLADWDIANSTPATDALPYLPPSFVSFQKDGSWKPQAWGLEPDKSAYMADSYLKLYMATGLPRYLQAARRIGATLLKLERPGGAWPFRVDPRTGKVHYGYTSSQLWYVIFFQDLADITANPSYRKPAEAAFHWLMDNPVRTNQWLGLYGDIASGAKSYDQWVPLEMAIYLIDHRHDHPGYVAQAREILGWINQHLVFEPGLHPGLPGLVEQSQYKVVLTHHELRLAAVYAELWEATRDPKDRQMAEDVANSVTWGLMSDGKMRQGFWYFSEGVPLDTVFDDQFCRIMSALPATAPHDRLHLLSATSLVGSIRYRPGVVDYSTTSASQDVLSAPSRPRLVRVEGTPLKERRGVAPGDIGWEYDPATHALKVRHAKGAVHIEVTAVP